MDHPESPSRGHRWIVLGLLIGFGALYSAFSWDRDFWAPEEDDFAAVTKEMSAAHEWLVPSLSGEPYFEKPPLLFWVALAFSKIPGLPPEVSYRLPIALFGVLGLWVTYLAGSRYMTRDVGVAAMVIQGTSALFFRTSSWLMADVVFSSLVSLALVSFGTVTLREPRSRRWRILGWLGLAGACLAKSPLLAFYLVAVPLIVFVLFYRKSLAFLYDLIRLRPLWGLLSVAVLVIPWYVWLGIEYGGAFFQEAFVHQHLSRLVDAASHQQPFGYYFSTILTDFLPWTLFLPLAVFHGFVHARNVSHRFFLYWLVLGFVSLSFISSKQGKYLLPLWTPLCTLTAAALLQTERQSLWEGFLRVGGVYVSVWLLRVGAVAVFVAAGVAAFGYSEAMLDLAGGNLSSDDAVRRLVSSSAFGWKAGAGLGAVSVVLGVASFKVAGVRVGSMALQQPYPIAAAAAAMLLVSTVFYSDLNSVKSARTFCESVRDQVGESPLAIYGRRRGSILYFVDRPVKWFPHVDVTASAAAIEPLKAYLSRPETVYLLINTGAPEKTKDYERLIGNYPRIATLVEEVDRGRVGSRRTYLLLRNRVETGMTNDKKSF